MPRKSRDGRGLFERAVDRILGVPAPLPSADGKVFHTTVSFPSGRLLVGQGFHFAELDQQYKDLKSEFEIGYFQLNQPWGRARLTTLLANRAGLIDVFIPDDGPDLAQEPGADVLFGGSADARFRDPCFPHQIPHDRHATSLMDRQVALDLLMSSGKSLEQAEADLRDISSTPDIEITVGPGEWHLYFHVDYEAMGVALTEAGIAAPRDSHFVLSKEPLALNPDRLVDLSEEFAPTHEASAFMAP